MLDQHVREEEQLAKACSNSNLWITILWVQGSVIFLLLGTGWLFAGYVRFKEIQRRLAIRLGPTPAKILDWPGVSVVMPLKGCRTSSQQSWESQVCQNYAGAIEYLLVVDSRDDPALRAASQVCGATERNVRIIVAPAAQRQSQKICNIQCGIKAASKEHKYVLCVDDDVTLHSHTLQECVALLQTNHDAFMLTGYPFDIPGQTSNVLTYSALSYHLPLLIGFCLPQTRFVWGGFMLFHLQKLLDDRYGIMKAWSDGGYSDDLIVAAQCEENNLRILSPEHAIFPQWLSEPLTFAQYWNYLRRQLYVMDTYCSPTNRRINHAMMILHFYLSLAFVLPATMVSPQLVAWAVSAHHTDGQEGDWTRQTNAYAISWAFSIYLASFFYAASALAWMTGVMNRLFCVLSPSLQHSIDSISWWKLWTGFFFSNWLLPFCIVYTKLEPSVIWSGLKYFKRSGKIVKTQRMQCKTSQPVPTAQL